nr:hypothetical protein [Tanacetum cinerariifolium]
HVVELAGVHELVAVDHVEAVGLDAGGRVGAQKAEVGAGEAVAALPVEQALGLGGRVAGLAVGEIGAHRLALTHRKAGVELLPGETGFGVEESIVGAGGHVVLRILHAVNIIDDAAHLHVAVHAQPGQRLVGGAGVGVEVSFAGRVEVVALARKAGAGVLRPDYFAVVVVVEA